MRITAGLLAVDVRRYAGLWASLTTTEQGAQEGK